MVTVTGKLSVDEIRLVLNVCKQRVSAIAKRYGWQVQRIGRICLYDEKDVNAYLASRQVNRISPKYKKAIVTNNNEIVTKL